MGSYAAHTPMSMEHPERPADSSDSEHLYCYRLVGGPMDGSSHLMTTDVMEMALPVSVSEESEFNSDHRDSVDGGSVRNQDQPAPQDRSRGTGSLSNEPSGHPDDPEGGYYHLYLWYGKVVDGSRVMEYHGYFSDDDDEI